MRDYHNGGTLDNRFKAIGILVAICILMTVQGAAQQAQIPVLSQGSGSRVLFIEHYLLANGTVKEGKSPFKSVNFPSYWYNENTKELNGKIDFPVDGSLIMIFGDVLTLRGNFGGGTGNKLYGVYSLPVKANQATIYSYDASGTVIIGVNNKTIALMPGESYSYTENETLREDKAVIKVTYDQTYVNHGFIDKKHLRSRFVSP
jgi:hypothetical protein